MPRSLSAGVQTAIAAQHAEFVHFIQLEFSGGTQRLSTGSTSMTWDSQTWTAVGGALEIAPVRETPDLSGGGVDVTLSGVDQTILVLLLTQLYIGRVVKVWLAHLNPTLGTVIADPPLLYAGFMNGGWSIEEQRNETGRGTGNVIVRGRFVNRLSALESRKGMQTNAASHQAFFPTDRFFEHMQILATRPVVWTR